MHKPASLCLSLACLLTGRCPTCHCRRCSALDSLARCAAAGERAGSESSSRQCSMSCMLPSLLLRASALPVLVHTPFHCVQRAHSLACCTRPTQDSRDGRVHSAQHRLPHCGIDALLDAVLCGLPCAHAGLPEELLCGLRLQPLSRSLGALAACSSLAHRSHPELKRVPFILVHSRHTRRMNERHCTVCTCTAKQLP